MTSPGTTAPSSLRTASIAAPLALFAIALVTRLIGVHHTPYVDELNHVMAAHAFLERGTLDLVPGGEPYTRARLFTYLVAAFFRVFGESLTVARIPAVLAGAALVTAVFIWVRSVAGRAAAWTAALLLCFQPESLYLSELARFYTIQTLCFFVGTVLVYRAVTTPSLSRTRLAQLIAGATLLWLLALHLQVITIVGIAGVLAWAIIDRAYATLSRRQLPAVVAVLIVAGALALFAIHRGLLGNQLAMFTYVDQWAEQNRHNVRFYHDLLLDQYATLWTLFPLLALLAIYRAPRAALLCLFPFLVAFVAHSLAAWKAERYLFSVMPMFFAVVGMGIAEGAARLRPAIARVVDDTLDWIAGHATTPRARSITLACLAAFIALFALIGNGATSYANKMLRTSDAEWSLASLYRGEPDWDAAHATLAPVIDSAALVISSSELKSLYYLHRADVLLSVDYLGNPRKADYFIFRKLGRPVVSTVSSLQQLRACYPTGVVVAERGQWRTPWSIQPTVADYIAATMDSVPVAASTRLIAWRWHQPVAFDGANCAAIHAVVHR